MQAVEKLSAKRAALLLVDMQDAFVPHIAGMAEVTSRCAIMIQAAKLLDLPVIVTEQYPKGLGRTIEPLQNMLGDVPYYDKVSFSCCGDDKIRRALLATGRNQIIIVGIETHVCIEQTTLDLLELGQQPFIIADAVSSRQISDKEIALAKMRDQGALVTTIEAGLMAMLGSSKHPAFRDISKLIK